MSEEHLHLTGKDVGPTLEFARRLAARKRPLWVRFVVVPGLTDNDEAISQIAKFAAGLISAHFKRKLLAMRSICARRA